MVGGLLAYVTLHKPNCLAKYRNLSSTLGLALLAASLALITSVSAFPGWWALLPTAGAMLLLAAGPDAWFNRHVLASQGAFLLGKIRSSIC